MAAVQDDPWASSSVPAAPLPKLDWLSGALRRVRRRSFLKKNPEQQAAEAIRVGELPRVLGRADLYLLSLGSVVGAGVFVLTGVAARDHAGPSVSLAYAFSAAAALLSAVCYLEFAVEAPRAGGAFSYVSVVGGELPAWIVASNLLLEYSLSIAAVARAATAYACTLAGASSPSATLIKIGSKRASDNSSSSVPFVELDPLAAAGVLALTALLAMGTAATARFNAVVTLINLIAIGYIVIAAAPLADPATNLRPFAPEGMRGVFAASSVVFFAFVGFDTVAAAAEDALDPTADLPVAIVGGVATAGALYALLSLALCAAVPRSAIDRTAPFSKLFLDHREKVYGSSLAKHRLASALLATSSRFVGFGALSGLVTAALVTILGQARLLLVLGRERLLPASLARLNAAGVPGLATWTTGITSAVLALFLDLGDLASLVSIGTLFVFACVALALLKRRHSLPGRGGARQCSVSLSCLVLSSLFLSLSYARSAPLAVSLVALALWIAAAASLYWLPRAYEPLAGGYRAPGLPLTPALAVLADVHLIASLPAAAHLRFAVCLVAAMLFYAFYGSRSAEEADAGGRAGVASVVELGGGIGGGSPFGGGGGGYSAGLYGGLGLGRSAVATDRELAEAAAAAAAARAKAAASAAAPAGGGSGAGGQRQQRDKQRRLRPSAPANGGGRPSGPGELNDDDEVDDGGGGGGNARLLSLRVVRLSSEDPSPSPTTTAAATTAAATAATATTTTTTTTTSASSPAEGVRPLPSDALSPKGSSGSSERSRLGDGRS